MLREDNLLCFRRQAFVCTTNSNHPLTVYPNLAGELKLSNINQLWVCDITCIRLRGEFVYLAVILDTYSRRCVGWAISRRIDTELALKALRIALVTRTVAQGLVHHSDRGVHGLVVAAATHRRPPERSAAERGSLETDSAQRRPASSPANG